MKFVAAHGLAINLAAAATIASPSAELSRWPQEAAVQLKRMIAGNANQSNYAVFDMVCFDS